MAVVDAFVTQNASSVAADVDIAARSNGEKVKTLFASFEVAAADSDGSIYRIGRISPMAIIKSIKILNDAITGATDYDIGVYKRLEVGGAVVSKDCLLNGRDINAGQATFAEVFAPDPANVGKALYQLASVTDYNEAGSYDLAVTANTVGSAAGTVALIVEYVDGV